MKADHVKKIMTISFFSLIVGVLISIPLRQEVSTYDTVSLSSIESLQTEIDSMNRELNVLDTTIASKKEEILKKENLSSKDDSELLNNIEKEIEEIKVVSGLEDVEGPGIKLIVADNESKEIVGQNVNDDIIHDSDIQIILNDLKRAGAEAISINGQRVVSKSEVKCGGPVIKINKKSSANPFVINVIGEPKALLAAVEAKDTYAYTLKNVYKIKLEASIEDAIFIPKYNLNEIDYKYVQVKKEGEVN